MLVYLLYTLIDLGILAIRCYRSWHIGDNMFFFPRFLYLSAFNLAFCFVLSSPHGSLPALEDKLGLDASDRCYPPGRCGVVCVDNMLDAVFWIIVKTREILRMLQTWNVC